MYWDENDATLKVEFWYDKALAVETGSSWVPNFYEAINAIWKTTPVQFDTYPPDESFTTPSDGSYATMIATLAGGIHHGFPPEVVGVGFISAVSSVSGNYEPATVEADGTVTRDEPGLTTDSLPITIINHVDGEGYIYTRQPATGTVTARRIWVRADPWFPPAAETNYLVIRSIDAGANWASLLDTDAVADAVAARALRIASDQGQGRAYFGVVDRADANPALFYFASDAMQPVAPLPFDIGGPDTLAIRSDGLAAIGNGAAASPAVAVADAESGYSDWLDVTLDHGNGPVRALRWINTP